MENIHTKRLVIGNFKSIKHLDIDCKKVNVFIGKPNVGKSNILEGISLLGATYSRNNEKFLSDFIRYEDFYNLFYDNDLENYIYVETDNASVYNRHISESEYFKITLVDKIIGNHPSIEDFLKKNYKKFTEQYFNEKVNDLIRNFNMPYDRSFFQKVEKEWFLGNFIIDSDGSFARDNRLVIPKHPHSVFKKYDFEKNTKINDNTIIFLNPPNGNNLFVALKNHKSLNREAISIFQEYGLNLVFKERDKIFEIQKNIDGVITEYPYSSMADTLQRIIFYLLAIETNKNSVLIFEEPEAHSFPPYTEMLAERIAEDESNQFFITTHSPYLLQTLVGNVDAENLNIFVTYYEDYQTKVSKISEEEFKDIDPMDIFFNLDKVNA